MKKLIIKNGLKFRDEKEKKLCEYYVELFVKKFVNTDLYNKVEITKDSIYLYKHNETGFNHFSIPGLQPKTSREMLIFLQAATYGISF